MILTQRANVITFGKDDMLFRFRDSKINTERFTASDVDGARSQLLAVYPDEADEINRLANRILAILP